MIQHNNINTNRSLAQAVTNLNLAMARREKYRKDNPLYALRLNPVQQKYFTKFPNPRYKTFVLKGNNRCSKTATGVFSSYAMMFGYLPWDPDRKPLRWIDLDVPRKIRHLCDDFPKHVDQVVRPEYEKWKPKDRKVGFYKNGQSFYSLIVDHKTGSRVDFITAQQDPKSHEGWYGKALIIDEPKSKEHYLASARGLVDQDGIDIFCLTLLKEHAWIKREIFSGLDEYGDPRNDIAMFHGDAKDNVGYGIASQVALERFYGKIYGDEAVLAARRDGDSDLLCGFVFSKFNKTEHMIDHFELPPNYPVSISIDYHPSKEVAVLFVATDEYDRKIAFHEIFDHMTPEETAYAIVDVITQYGVTNVPDDVLIDPLSKGDKNNENTVFDRIEGILGAYDLTMRTTGQEKRQKHNGIARINELFRSPSGSVNFHVTRNCRRLIFEFENQVLDETTGNPKKEFDDMTECLYRIILQDMPFDGQAEREKIWGAQIASLYAARCHAGGGSESWMGM